MSLRFVCVLAPALAALSLAAAAASPDAADPLLGKWVSKVMTVVVEAAGSTYKGVITLDDKSYPFTAHKEEDGVMSGVFKSGDDSFDFAAKADAKTLLVKSGDNTYMLLRDTPAAPRKVNPLDRSGKQAANPLAKGSAAGEGAPPGDPDWNLLRHPVGLSMRYPRDWTVREVPNAGYQLIPPNADQREVYILGGQPAPGISSPDDPRLVAAIEQMMAQLGPLLHRVGPVEKVHIAAGTGIILTWEGGQNARARAYVGVAKGSAIGLTGIGAKELIEKREPTLLKMFQSFSTDQGKRDPAVVGAWNRLGTTGLDAHDNVGRLQASSASDHHETLVLRPDGSCMSREVSRTIANGAGVSIDTGDQVTNKSGHWYAGDGKLVLLWDNAAPQEYGYRVNGGAGGRQLVFLLGNGRGILWTEGR